MDALNTKIKSILTEKTLKVRPENIKKDISILGITGTYEGSGGGAVEENDVNFYDYDGTLLYSYSKTDFLELTEMPENPTREGLTAQGWNWTLADAKTYVTDYGELNIGQTYTTTSGKTEIEIELNLATGLTVTLNMNGTKDWGDGTTDTNTSHTYSSIGKYTITCDGDTITDKLFGQTSSSQNFYCKSIKFANITTIPNYQIQYCMNLHFVVLPNSITQISDYSFQYCSLLHTMIIPSSVTSLPGYSIFQSCYSLQCCILPKFSTTFALGNNVFVNCYSLRKISLSENITSLGISSFSYNNSLKAINIPKSITTIGNYSFSQTKSLVKLDFSKFTSIPTLNNRNAFDDTNKLLQIIVPDNLYASWRTEGYWIYLQNNIVRASDYVE